jgi:hypothetical protein
VGTVIAAVPLRSAALRDGVVKKPADPCLCR